MSPSEQPAAEYPAGTPAEPRIERVETPIGSITGTLHRAPRYSNFMILGAIIGVMGALLLTAVFPENADFSQTQIFGFLLLATVAVGVGLGASVALLLDRVFGRTAKSVVADRVGVHESRADTAPDAASDTQTTNEKSE